MKHPTERGTEGRTLFDRSAEAASNFSSSPMFFTLCGLLVAAWAVSYLLVSSDTVHHVLADAMAAVTLLLVALLKNAERRAEHAIQAKLDRLAEAMLAERANTGRWRGGARGGRRMHDELTPPVEGQSRVLPHGLMRAVERLAADDCLDLPSLPTCSTRPA